MSASDAPQSLVLPSFSYPPLGLRLGALPYDARLDLCEPLLGQKLPLLDFGVGLELPLSSGVLRSLLDGNLEARTREEAS